MMSIITRKFFESMGQNPPKELAYVVSDFRGRRMVTWAEVIETRRRNQVECLERKREWGQYPWRAHRLSVAYFNQTFFGGWHAFLEDYRGTDHRIWIEKEGESLFKPLMEIFPLILPLGSEHEQWEQWKVSFAEQFERRRQDGRPLGVAYIWWNGRDLPRHPALAADIRFNQSQALKAEEVKPA